MKYGDRRRPINSDKPEPITGESPIKDLVKAYMKEQAINYTHLYREPRKTPSKIIEHNRHLKFYGVWKEGGFSNRMHGLKLNMRLRGTGFKAVVDESLFGATSIVVLRK